MITNLIPTLILILVTCGCSRNKDLFPTPENATVILLCSSVLQTNEDIKIIHRLDEVITGTLDPRFLNESNILKGLSQPTIENLNIPEKYFIFAKPVSNARGTDSFRVEHSWSYIPVYDESLLAHKNDIQFLQSEFDRLRKISDEIMTPQRRKDMQAALDKELKKISEVNSGRGRPSVND